VVNNVVNKLGVLVKREVELEMFELASKSWLCAASERVGNSVPIRWTGI